MTDEDPMDNKLWKEEMVYTTRTLLSGFDGGSQWLNSFLLDVSSLSSGEVSPAVNWVQYNNAGRESLS